MKELELVKEIVSIILLFQRVIDESHITKVDIMKMAEQNLHEKSTKPEPNKD